MHVIAIIHLTYNNRTIIASIIILDIHYLGYLADLGRHALDRLRGLADCSHSVIETINSIGSCTCIIMITITIIIIIIITIIIICSLLCL